MGTEIIEQEQITVLGKNTSVWKRITSGVPPGQCPWAITFSIYINELPN